MFSFVILEGLLPYACCFHPVSRIWTSSSSSPSSHLIDENNMAAKVLKVCIPVLYVLYVKIRHTRVKSEAADEVRFGPLMFVYFCGSRVISDVFALAEIFRQS